MSTQFPAQNIITDQGYYPFQALASLIRTLIANAIALVIGAGASSVVWRPGAVSAGNVFGTWAEVVAAVAAMNGAVTIGVDTTIAPAVIPLGAWDLRPAGVTGSVELADATPGDVAPFVTIANAAVTIDGLTGLKDVQLENRSTSNVITCGGANNVNFYMRGFASLYQSVLCGAGVSFIAATAAPTTGAFNFCLYMQDFSYIGSLDGGVSAIRVTAAVAQISIEDSSIFDANMLVSPGLFVNVLVSASTVQFVGIDPYETQALAPLIVPFAYLQRGTAAIVVGTGKTAAIPAFITATSRIDVSLKAPTGDALTIKYAALAADRTSGNPGSFRVSALSAAGGGAVNGVDTSTVDYIVYSS